MVEPLHPPRTLADLSADALGNLARFLTPRDIANLAVTCKSLQTLAYSDPVWDRLFKNCWPRQFLSYEDSPVREQYLARHFALRQFKYYDPVEIFASKHQIPVSHILLDGNVVLAAHGSTLQRWIVASQEFIDSQEMKGHGSRIICVRLFPVGETNLSRHVLQLEENGIITSSTDRTIRIWFKGQSQRCFRGHTGPVTTLADKLLGNTGTKILASGGEDCTIRLWSLSGTRKHNGLVSTYYGHEKPLSFLAAAGHKTSLLVSISKDSKVKVWDILASPSSGSSSCIGMTTVGGPPVAMKCFETLCYVAAGSLVTAIDLRTMQKAFTAADYASKVFSFEMLPSKWSICTGVEEKALLWDIRKNEEKPKPVADLDFNSRVTFLHMDPYKIVTGGSFDSKVDIWETNTGCLANSFHGPLLNEDGNAVGLSAMAVDGCRILTGCCSDVPGLVHYRDFSDCCIPVSTSSTESKFWQS